MQVESRKARRLVDLLNSGTILRVLGRTTSTGHAAGSTTLLRVNLRHDRIGNALESLLLGFVLKNC